MMIDHDLNHDLESSTARRSDNATSTRRTTALGHFGALIAVALVLWIATVFGMGAVVLATFGQILGGLVAVMLIIAASIVLITLIVRRLTGRRHVLRAVVTTATAVVVNGVALARFGTIPMVWVQPGFELVHLVVALLSACVLGAFWGPWWGRLACVVVAIVGVSWVIWASPGKSSTAESAEALAQQRQESANFEEFIENGVYPVVTDLPDSSFVQLAHDGGPFRSLVLTADGGVLDIAVNEPSLAVQAETWPCWSLSEPNAQLDASDSVDDYASWCVPEGDGWRRVDGTGVTRVLDGNVVTVTAATQASVEIARGVRPANPSEVGAAAAQIRFMTTEEVRDALEQEWTSR